MFCLQFKEISFAYEVLSNPEKRELYDRYGEKGLREGAGMGGKRTDVIKKSSFHYARASCKPFVELLSPEFLTNFVCLFYRRAGGVFF